MITYVYWMGPGVVVFPGPLLCPEPAQIQASATRGAK